MIKIPRVRSQQEIAIIRAGNGKDLLDEGGWVTGGVCSSSVRLVELWTEVELRISEEPHHSFCLVSRQIRVFQKERLGSLGYGFNGTNRLNELRMVNSVNGMRVS